MSNRYDLVKLPDGKVAIQEEHTSVGGSETQLSYCYYDPITKKEIDRYQYTTDYWGDIKGVEYIRGYNPMRE